MIFSTGSCFTILSPFHLVIASAILFPKNSPALWTTLLESVFKGSSPVCNNCFLYFLANYKISYPLTFFLVLGSTEYRRIAKFEKLVTFIY